MVLIILLQTLACSSHPQPRTSSSLSSSVRSAVTSINFYINSDSKKVKVIFELVGYSGMFLMAGGIGACGVIVTFLMAEDIKYERVKKENRVVKA